MSVASERTQFKSSAELDELMCTIVSLVPFEIREKKPGLFPSHYIIPASVDGQPQLLHVNTAFHFVYIGEDRGSLRVPTPGDDVARSVVNDYISGQLAIGTNCHPAIFWVPGRRSVDVIREAYYDRIEIAKRAQINWFTAICRLADNDWNRYHQHNVISDFQRTAAKLINWDASEHIWMNQGDVIGSTNCPGCGTRNPGGIAKCSCGCIIDQKLYDSLVYA